MATERGLDRVVFFTDAVVAIAITLLILPLVDAVPEAAASGDSVGSFLSDNVSQLIGFTISFWVISRLWRAHHGVFRHVRAYTPLLIYVSLAWAFTIAVLPLSTAIVSEFADVDRIGMAVYVGTMTASSLTLTVLSVLVRRIPGVQEPSDALSLTALANSVSSLILFVVISVVATVTLSFWTFFLLFFSGLLSRGVERLLRRWTPGSVPAS